MKDPRQGKVFSDAEPGEVIDFLQHRSLESHTVPPEMLHMVNEKDDLFVRIVNGKVCEYPIRKAFLLKLLKWFHFPTGNLGRLSTDTVASILNDYLLAIKGKSVTVRIEDGEALSITSDRFTEFDDLDLLPLLKSFGITSITRDDFATRVFTEMRARVEPIPGDTCGLGFNIFNSETGFCAVSVRHFIYRYICSNGAVTRLDAGTESRGHYGLHRNELHRFLMGEIRKGEKESDNILRRLLESVNESSDKVLPEATVNLNRLIGRKRTNLLLSGLPEMASRYDLMNAITDMAKTLDPGRRLQAEALGGDLLTTVAIGGAFG